MGSSWIRPLPSVLLSAGRAFRVAKFSLMICVLGIFVHLCRGLEECNPVGTAYDTLKKKYNAADVITAFGKVTKIEDDDVDVTLECMMKTASAVEKLNQKPTLTRANYKAGDNDTWCYPKDTAPTLNKDHVLFLKKNGEKFNLVDHAKMEKADAGAKCKAGQDFVPCDTNPNDAEKCLATIDAGVTTNVGEGGDAGGTNTNSSSTSDKGQGGAGSGPTEKPEKPGNAGVSHTISLTCMWIAAAMSTGSIYIFM